VYFSAHAAAYLSKESVEQYISPGDIVGYGADPSKCIGMMEELSLVTVAGNHDWLYEKDPDLGRSLVPRSVTYLQDNMVEIEGLKIYGAPWTPYFLGWAFNLHRGHRLREKWNKIPRGIDVLVTQCIDNSSQRIQIGMDIRQNGVPHSLQGCDRTGRCRD